MGSTYLSLHYHLIFSTKERLPTLAPEWRSDLYDYMAGTIIGLAGEPQGIGGIANHVHLLVGLKATRRLAEFMREVKKSSSRWIHDHLDIQKFAWQEGYSAFTVSPSARKKVQNYIASQEEHHKTQSFQEEIVQFLNQIGIPYDPKILD